MPHNFNIFRPFPCPRRHLLIGTQKRKLNIRCLTWNVWDNGTLACLLAV